MTRPMYSMRKPPRGPPSAVQLSKSTDTLWLPMECKPPANARGAAWGDYDSDGDLDLFVAHEQESDTNNAYPNALYVGL